MWPNGTKEPLQRRPLHCRVVPMERHIVRHSKKRLAGRTQAHTGPRPGLWLRTLSLVRLLRRPMSRSARTLLCVCPGSRARKRQPHTRALLPALGEDGRMTWRRLCCGTSAQNRPGQSIPSDTAASLFGSRVTQSTTARGISLTHHTSTKQAFLQPGPVPRRKSKLRSGKPSRPEEPGRRMNHACACSLQAAAREEDMSLRDPEAAGVWSKERPCP